MTGALPPVVALFGPTAGGKSALALALAGLLDAEIINADSRQLYARMPIITACPSAAEYARVKHHLFEYVDPALRVSAATWAEQAQAAIKAVLARGRLPLLVGGTGLYMRALMDGLSEVPAVTADAELPFAGRPVAELYALLGEVDPDLAAKLHSSDTQRIIRGLAVCSATGVPLSQWQKGERQGAPFRFIKLGLMPERAVLHARIHQRWLGMVEAGVVDEIAALREAGYTPDMPGLTGLGIPQFFAYLAGEIALEEAVQAGATAHRQYAKRQCTWLANTYRPDLLQQHADADAAAAYVRARIGDA